MKNYPKLINEVCQYIKRLTHFFEDNANDYFTQSDVIKNIGGDWKSIKTYLNLLLVLKIIEKENRPINGVYRVVYSKKPLDNLSKGGKY